jgi:hypothetical protein
MSKGIKTIRRLGTTKCSDRLKSKTTHLSGHSPPKTFQYSWRTMAVVGPRKKKSLETSRQLLMERFKKKIVSCIGVVKRMSIH